MSLFVHLSPREGKLASAIFERLFPTDDVPGATEIGVADYLDRALGGAYRSERETYRLGLAALDRAARNLKGNGFAECGDEGQDDLLTGLEHGTLPDFHSPDQLEFFELLRAHLQEGLFADPAYGGNRDKLGWQVLGHPGVYLENSAEENLSDAPVTKGGKIQSLGDVMPTLQEGMTPVPGYDPQLGSRAPEGEADVVIVGMGAVGGLIAPVLAGAGLKVVGLEAGPYRSKRDFLPDELGHSYYARASMGPKFLQEIPQWRRSGDEPTREATFSLGKMMNSVGGSVIHYGAWLRRFHPHHFMSLSRVRERWGEDVLPSGCTLADWPVTYADLEPYYDRLERTIGVAGPDETPYIPRRGPHPMPPLRDFRLGQAFSAAARELGLHPYPVPAGMNSVPYGGRPATTYTAWSNGFGSYNDAKWHPGLSSVPEALATGRLQLKTHCRVLNVLTDSEGHACGVTYLDANGKERVQRARRVILSSYTFENVRLMLLSGSTRHPDGLGHTNGQLGKHFMTKMFAHVDGFCPDQIFNRHTGPAAQGVIVDDYLAEGFDSVEHGFIGGATLGAEQQFLPLQISREALPDDVPRWGKGYKDHLRQWQRFGVVRIQPDTLPYEHNYLDLDPVRKDTSGLGLPVVRITYDMQANESNLADWMEGKAEEILRHMGATKTWRGPRFTGVGSSHDLGGCRAGDDPGLNVLGRDLQVHDTPGLYVFGGAAFASCPGINPTLTIWAMCLRAAERLVQTAKETL